jgi:heat shock protein beta
LSFLKIKNSKDDSLISLDSYLEDHKKDEEQKAIYYITGSESKQNIFSKLYQSKGYTILYFDEPIDEFMLQRVSKYKESELINICKDHTTPWQSDVIAEEEDVKTFIEWIKTTLNDSNIETIKISTKLLTADDDPLCILSSKWGWSGNMEKIMQSQPLGDAKNMMFMKGKRILELNLGNPTIKNIFENYKKEGESYVNQIRILYNCGLLSAGFPIENTNNFVSNIYQSLQSSIAV